MNGNEFRHNLQRIMDASLYYISNKPTNTEESEEVISGAVVPLNPAEQEKAKKKRQGFRVFAQFLFKDSEHDNIKDMCLAKLTEVRKEFFEWMDDTSNPGFSLSKKTVLGLEFFLGQMLYAGFAIAMGVVRIADFHRRKWHGKWVMECAKNAGYEEELNEVIENYCLGTGPLNPFNGNQILTTEQSDSLNPIMKKLKKLGCRTR